MVGPTTTELESLNELIKFDHVYYKAEDGVASSVAVATASQAVSKSSKVQPTSVKSLLKTNIAPITAATVAVTPIVNDVTPSNVMTSDNSDVFNLPQALENIDFAALGESLEQQLIDLDAILRDSSVAMETAQEEKASDTTSEPSPKKRKLCESDFVQEPKIKIEKDTASVLPDEIFSTPSPDFLTVPRSPVLAKSAALSDSGYSSEFSDSASSPRNGSSPNYDMESHWEESFTELFPSLL